MELVIAVLTGSVVIVAAGLFLGLKLIAELARANEIRTKSIVELYNKQIPAVLSAIENIKKELTISNEYRAKSALAAEATSKELTISNEYRAKSALAAEATSKELTISNEYRAKSLVITQTASNNIPDLLVRLGALHEDLSKLPANINQPLSDVTKQLTAIHDELLKLRNTVDEDARLLHRSLADSATRQEVVGQSLREISHAISTDVTTLK